MIDIHSHFLPGIDDGATSMETAVAMVKMAAEDGTTHLVATPHCNASYTFSPERNSDLLDELRVRTGGRITLLSGCDFHLSYENIQQVLTDKTPFTLNQGEYLLAEFSQYGIAPQALDVFHKLRLADIVPIITHPERNPLLQGRGYDYLQKLVEMGCPVQVTAASLTGGFGERAKEFSDHLLEQGMVHLIASDAHDTGVRSPRLSPARSVVAGKFGTAVAQALLVENPRAVIESRPLAYWPERPLPPKPRRRFWFF